MITYEEMMKNREEQLSFFTDKPKEEKQPPDTSYIDSITVCGKCICNACTKNCESDTSTREEAVKEIEAGSYCFNCDECYWYGMDNESLSRHVVKYECEKFVMNEYWINKIARIKRRKMKVIK